MNELQMHAAAFIKMQYGQLKMDCNNFHSIHSKITFIRNQLQRMTSWLFASIWLLGVLDIALLKIETDYSPQRASQNCCDTNAYSKSK